MKKNSNNDNLGLYIHIPFCSFKCVYCNFYSTTYDSETIYGYIEFLEKEFEKYQNLFDGKVVDTIYIGGGTPSVFDIDQLELLFSMIDKRLKKADDTEITIESNPESLSRDKALKYRELGINRISIGIQSLNDDELKFLKRAHTKADAKKGYDIAKEAGFENISVDLIYSIPGQSRASWIKSLRELVRWRPKHISAYELTKEDETELGKLVQAGKIKMEPDDGEFSDLVLDILSAYSYNQYEISNFARKGFECRHNLKYWHYDDYIGLGPSASSKLGDTRWSNISDIFGYEERLKNGGLPILNSERLRPETVMVEELMMGLRLPDGMRYKKEYRNIKPVADLIDDGILIVSNGTIKLERSYLGRLNFILEKIV